MKILVAGDFAHQIYEPDFCAGLRECGAVVSEFRALALFGPTDLLRRAQSKLLVGPGIALANAALIAKCLREKPDVVLCWRTCWLHSATIRAMRLAGAQRVVLYNNDDPFGPDREALRWRRFRRLIPAADLCFAYRRANLSEYREAGAREVKLLRSWYRREVHHPVALSAADHARFDCDVVFVGHCEPDERLDLMDALLASGLNVKLFGTDWQAHARGRRWERMKIEPVIGADYVKAIAAAKVAVVFLSRRNRDQYTRRCFEIPAIGTPMLAPRTQEMQALFAERSEVALYASAEELLATARALISDPSRRERMSAAAHARAVHDGYDVVGRARQFLADLEGADLR